MAFPLTALVRRSVPSIACWALVGLCFSSGASAGDPPSVSGLLQAALPRHGAAASAARNPAVIGRDAVLVVDAGTGRELDGSHADDLRHPASLTKMMTLYLLFQALDSGRLRLDDAMPVSARAVAVQPTRLGVVTGSTLLVREAAMGLIVKSANDAAVVVAEALAGDETAFAELMTRAARQLGMRSTQFRNASGLPHPAQVTTARDMAVLARALLIDFPHYYGLFATRTWAFRGREMRNHNRLLLTYPGSDGVKTGYINSSGFNLVTSAMRDGRRLIGVVLGGDSAGERDAIMAAVLDTGFNEAARQQLPLWAGTSVPRSARYHAAQFMAPAHAVQARQTMGNVPATSGPTMPEASQWAIQIGAFGDAGSARSAIERALAIAPELRRQTVSRIDRIAAGNRTLFRARLIAADEETAQRGCRRLEARKIACTTIEPSGTSAQLR